MGAECAGQEVVRALLLRGASSDESEGVRSWRHEEALSSPEDMSPRCAVTNASQRCEAAADFVGDAAAFKKLFSLAMSRRESATVAIHRVGRTLVVDGGDDSGERGAATPWPRSSRDNAVLASEDASRLVRVARRLAGAEIEAALRELCSREGSEEEEWGVAECKSCGREATRGTATEVLEGIVGSRLAPSEREEGSLARVPHEYARVLFWRLRGMRLISGTDCVVVPGARPTTLRMAPADDVEKDREATRLAVVDYYLENLLAGAPQLALCLERRGVVVGARVCETDQVPAVLSSGEPLFEARNLELQAAALLRFVAEHCATDGATYVLRQDAAEDVELFDVSSLCDPTKRKWKWLLATLSARFAHRIASHDVGLLEPQQERELRRRRRLLLETALELLADLDDLDDEVGTHFVMRAGLEEQLASTYLHAGTQQCELSDLEAASRHLEIGLELVERRISAAASASPDILKRRARELAEGVVDLALALAHRHLAHRDASSLMRELRRAVKLEGDAARAADVWRCATAFAAGVAADRYAWSDKGAHASDAVAFVNELAGGRLEPLCAPSVDELAGSRAAAAREWLVAAEAAFGKNAPRTLEARRLFGDACNHVGRIALDRGDSSSAEAWFRAAVSSLDGRDQASARLNLAVALRHEADEAALDAARRQCGLALDALGGLKTEPNATAWDAAQLETAATDLALAVARRRRLFGAAWATEAPLPPPALATPAEPVLAPLERALRVYDAYPDDANAPCAHFQLGSFLALLAKRERPPKQHHRLALAKHHLELAKHTFDQISPHRILCAVEISDLLATVQAQPPDPKRALLALFELLQPRDAAARLDAAPHAKAALAALRARLAPRAKSLLAAANRARPHLQQPHSTMAACKDAYRAALRPDDADLPGTLDHLRQTLAPLFVFQVPFQAGTAAPPGTTTTAA